jgi:hypothetical protein
MLVHSVYFYLKPEASEAEKAELKKGLETLKTIAEAEKVFVGIPAAVPERPVLDKSYAAGLVVLFKGLQAHDAYQVHPIHKDFLAKHKHLWSRVQVYDVQT